MTLRMSSRRGSIAALVAIGGLLLTTAPAWAHGTGATTNGYSNVDIVAEPEAPLCLPAGDLEIELYNVGTFNNSPGPYETEAQFSGNETFYFGPGGTYSDNQCDVPAAVEGTLTVSGDVTCTAADAEYQRIGTGYTIETTETTTCTITGTSNSDISNLLFFGTQQACDPDPMVDPCGPPGSSSLEFVGEYTQS